MVDDRGLSPQARQNSSRSQTDELEVFQNETPEFAVCERTRPPPTPFRRRETDFCRTNGARVTARVPNQDSFQGTRNNWC